MVRIAIDCMGGDHGLSVTIPACLRFLKLHPDVQLVLVGKQAEIEAALARKKALEHPQITIRHASEVVEMDEPPAQALRNKKDSSIRVCANLVKDGLASAFVSAGNTGALMAISRFVLKTMDSIDRPAIASALPNMKGTGTLMLDLGANVDCEPAHLFQFAVMGSAFVKNTEGIEKPTVGLLNIGEEVIKGNEVVKKASELLRASELNFYGNVEGNDIYKGTTDVVVCDGFVGNVALKTSEGLAQMLGDIIKAEFKRGLWPKVAAVFAAPVLLRFKKRVDHRRYNGAALLGLKGIVIKSHGSADAYAFFHAIKRAYDAANGNLLDSIRVTMSHYVPLAAPAASGVGEAVSARVEAKPDQVI
ncbi:MAG: phosphate acyltransferase PlsX [Limnobacter sp.]|uniref:phosphate acyltransferase PlsX n=1 Tax=Limnobacter sp. TaxID=2003368 RepID=UPI0032ED910F